MRVSNVAFGRNQSLAVSRHGWRASLECKAQEE